MLIDVASIVFVCVTVNHLGLISAIEEVTGKKLPIVNCPKCLTFWITMGYCCDQITVCSVSWAITILATSFLASYSALWLELLEGYIDTLYMKLYEKITKADTDNTVTTDANDGYSAGSVSEL